MLQNLVKSKSSTRWFKSFRIPDEMESDKDVRHCFDTVKMLARARDLLPAFHDVGNLTRFTRRYMPDLLRVLGKRTFIHYMSYLGQCNSDLDYEVYESFVSLCE